MRKHTISYFLFLLAIIASGITHAQNPVNWTEKQLMEPADLARSITAKKDVPVIVNIGPSATIPNSIDVGMANSKEGIQKLKTDLKDVARDKKIVIYCGCCPFDHCPNVRPALEVLKQMKFTNYYLLDLPHNIRKDWTEKGYPVNKS